ncbi:MAG: 4Fe-4S binding protein [Planctomycetia bacterium]|nr:4Fe-4S binding protein [Planctomycetia bacterium]
MPDPKSRFVSRQLLPDVDSRLCTLCGDCVDVCPTECLSIARDCEVVLVPQACINCAVCEAVCPATAITMRTQDW